MAPIDDQISVTRLHRLVASLLQWAACLQVSYQLFTCSEAQMRMVVITGTKHSWSAGLQMVC